MHSVGKQNSLDLNLASLPSAVRLWGRLTFVSLSFFICRVGGVKITCGNVCNIHIYSPVTTWPLNGKRMW